VSTVPAAHQALAILRYLSRQAGPVPAAAIVRDLDLPRSTVYHLLATLADDNFVTRLADEQRYALGLAAYELGTGYTRQAPLQRVARVPLADLVDRVGPCCTDVRSSM
jgi:DNA-binding IclR family transcriptional regulator